MQDDELFTTMVSVHAGARQLETMEQAAAAMELLAVVYRHYMDRLYEAYPEASLCAAPFLFGCNTPEFEVELTCERAHRHRELTPCLRVSRRSGMAGMLSWAQVPRATASVLALPVNAQGRRAAASCVSSRAAAVMQFARSLETVCVAGCAGADAGGGGGRRPWPVGVLNWSTQRKAAPTLHLGSRAVLKCKGADAGGGGSRPRSKPRHARHQLR